MQDEKVTQSPYEDAVLECLVHPVIAIIVKDGDGKQRLREPSGLEIARHCGCDKGVVYRLLENGEFTKRVDRIRRAERCTKKPEADRALFKEVAKGNIRAIELFYKLSGELTDKHEVQVSGGLAVDLSEATIDELKAAREKAEQAERDAGQST